MYYLPRKARDTYETDKSASKKKVRMSDINEKSSHAWKGLQLNIQLDLLSNPTEIFISCQEFTRMINYAFIYALNREYGMIKINSPQQLEAKM